MKLGEARVGLMGVERLGNRRGADAIATVTLRQNMLHLSRFHEWLTGQYMERGPDIP